MICVTLRKRVRETISLLLWMIMAVTGAVVKRIRPRRQDRALRAVTTPRVRTPRARLPRGRFATHAVAVSLGVVVFVPELLNPALRLAAGPLAARRWQPLAQRSTVVAADGSVLTVLHDGVNRRVVPLRDVPQVVRQAVLAAEDRRFLTHEGYDAEAVGRALVANARAGGVTQGGSTITQQLAKQNFVGDDRTVLRKGKELLYAVALEQRYTKDQLLERYLNQVYFGGQAYGVAAAAEEFFRTDVSRLSLEQAALLAGLIRAPAALDPRAHPDAAKTRRNEVLQAMAGAGFVKTAAATAAAGTPLKVAPSRPAENFEPFVVEAVKREVLANPAFGKTPADRRRRLLTGGLRIETSVEPRLQAAAKVATAWVPAHLGSAVVAVAPKTGRVVALYDGGAAAAGQFDVATQGARQPGSTFKPVVAAAALEAGMPEWQELVGSGPIELDYPNAPAPWRVDNFDGEEFGPIDLRDAVIDSVNTAFAQLAVALGPNRISQMAQRLGIDVDRALGPPTSRGPAMALGGVARGVSPLELASAYGTFAAEGRHVQPHLIDRVLGPDGKELYQAAPAAQVALDRSVNAGLVSILEDAVSYGTGAAAALPDWEVLGKTGTSDGSADGWFVGAVPLLSTAVWVGHPESERPVPGLTGGAMSAPVWRMFMAEALRTETPVGFPAAPATRANVKPLELPAARSAA